MGYLLPVNHYQYYDYQRRTVKGKQDPFHIEKPSKIIMEANYQDYHGNQVEPDGNTSLKMSTPKLPATDHLYAQLTGKGRNFNKYV